MARITGKLASGEDIIIIIGADDQTKAAFQSASQGMQNMDSHVKKLHREMDKLTSASGYAAEGLKRMHHMIVGFTIGLVAGAVHEFVNELIFSNKEADKASKQMDEMTRVINAQATAWKLLPEPINAVTQEEIALYNAQLSRMQLDAPIKINQLKSKLDEARREISIAKQDIEKGLMETPDMFSNFFGEAGVKAKEQAMGALRTKIADTNIAIATMNRELKVQEDIYKRQPADLKQVAYNLGKNADALVTVQIAEDDSYAKREKLIAAVLLETEKLGASKEKLMEIESRQFLVGGADIEQINRYVKALEGKRAKEEEIARKEKELALEARLAKEAEPKMPPPATVPINIKTDSAEITRLKALLALHKEYNDVLAQGNQVIEQRIIASAAAGVITGEEMAGMLAQIEVQKIDLALKQAMQSALAQYILGQQSLGQALKLALAQALAQKAAQAAVEALWETAKAIAAFAVGNAPGAVLHLKAAALYASVGAVAGVAASQFAQSASMGTGPQGSATNPSYTQPSQNNGYQYYSYESSQYGTGWRPGEGSGTTIIVHGDVYAQDSDSFQKKVVSAWTNDYKDNGKTRDVAKRYL